MNKKESMEQLKSKISKYNKDLQEAIYRREGFMPEEFDNPNDYEEQVDEIDFLSRKVEDLESDLRRIEYSDEEGDRRSEISKLIYKEGYIIRDSESINDYLSRTQHAEEICKLISNKKTLSPLTLGIYGPWGEGKSSFLRLIESELENINCNIKKNKEAEKNYNKTHVVKFDASEYDDQDKIWFSLLSQLFAKYEEELGVVAKLKYGYVMLNKSFKENKWKYIINIIILSIFVGWIIVYSKDKSIIELITKNSFYANVIGLITTVAVSTNIVMPLLKKIKAISKPMSEKVISQLKYPDYRDLLGTREKVKESLDVLIEVWTKKRGDKIVIMVDELDRCSQKTIVEFFDALQLFLPLESIIHVISINQEAVSFALANNNLHFFDQEVVPKSEKLAFGKDYLGKYITIPYHLPYQKNYKEYITELLTDRTDIDEVEIFNNAEKDTLIKAINIITKNRHVTPREMKKIINLLFLSKERILNTNLHKEEGFILKFEEYISWFLLRYFYPETAKIIIDNLQENYRYNQYKTFNQIKQNILFKKEFNQIPVSGESKKLFQFLDNTRIEYIILSNTISDSLII